MEYFRVKARKSEKNRFIFGIVATGSIKCPAKPVLSKFATPKLW